MSLVANLGLLFRNIAPSINETLTNITVGGVIYLQKRNTIPHVELPTIGRGRQFRRIIHYPKDGKYTTEPLEVTRMGGRDPVSGRVAVKKIGGGVKYKYTWVDLSFPQSENAEPIYEKIVDIQENIMCRTAKTALVATGDRKRWIIATENMKVGDIIKTHFEIPRIPVRPKEGDSHPIGALPIGTLVCNVEPYPKHIAFYGRAAGTMVQILRKVKDRVIIQLPSKHEVSVNQWAMVRIGQVSNKEHSSTPIGSANKNRWLGNRPCSGLWQRKTGYHGRKIRPLPPIRVMDNKATVKDLYCSLTSTKT